VGGKLPRGVSIRKHRSGTETLYVSFTYRGVPCRESIELPPTLKNIRYADNLVGEINNRISRQSFSFSEFFPESKSRAAKLFGRIRSNITVSQLFNNANWSDLAPKLTTAYTYEKDSKWANEYLGHIPVTDLSVKDVRDWVKSMAHLKRKTISNRMTPLRVILAMAVDDEVIQTNPCDSVTLGKQSKGLVSREQRESDEVIDPFDNEEITSILKAAYEYHPKAGNYFQLAFYAGLRHSELKGLQWTDVDFINGTLEINQAMVSMGKESYVQTPKTLAGKRTIELVPKAMEALKNQQALNRFAKGNVFTRFEDSELLIDHNDHYWRPWQDILTMAEVRYRAPKQTRHTFASHLLTLGENPALIADQMGHTDVSMVYRVYAKFIKGKGRYFSSDFGK